MVKFLLDTDICISGLRDKYNMREVIAQKGESGAEIFLSAVTIAELEVGMAHNETPKRRSALKRFLTPFEIIPFDIDAARAFGRVRSALESGGQRIGAYDMQIAAEALAKDLILVTHNTKEFERIAGLRIEDWVEDPG